MAENSISAFRPKYDWIVNTTLKVIDQDFKVVGSNPSAENGHTIFTYICVRIVMFAWKDEKMKKRPRMAHFIKKALYLNGSSAAKFLQSHLKDEAKNLRPLSDDRQMKDEDPHLNVHVLAEVL